MLKHSDRKSGCGAKAYGASEEQPPDQKIGGGLGEEEPCRGLAGGDAWSS